MKDGGRQTVSDTIATPKSTSPFRRVLDPVDRAAEILFGLIMVMTFTGSLGVAQAGSADVKAMIVGALSCNLAWGIIDAVMFLMSSTAERRLSKKTVEAVQTAASPSIARSVIEGALPPLVLPALCASDFERIRLHLNSLPADKTRVGIQAQDFVGALAVFVLVFSLTFPVVAPFFFIGDVTSALRVSNGIAIGLLFITGYTLGRHAGAPLRIGLLMVAVGLGMVAIALVLGG
ncbi:VIT1/CCC1 transporter family protein [Ensifer sp. PDNC004]|uniref:VIT1/CCC1 transporter family protein n=1 Tax=Ensifer sp. PDNC004 TaxID=2811423 RepID=UPI001FEE93FF|nr:VIT1/CCC1 transporter family protein [Ensifer sp. PDNC004]